MFDRALCALLDRQILHAEAQRRADVARLDRAADRARQRAAVEQQIESYVRVMTSMVRFGWYWPSDSL